MKNITLSNKLTSVYQKLLETLKYTIDGRTIRVHEITDPFNGQRDNVKQYDMLMDLIGYHDEISLWEVYESMDEFTEIETWVSSL